MPYWTARAQEALGQRDAAMANDKAYLELRANSKGDKLAADAKRRAGSKGKHQTMITAGG